LPFSFIGWIRTPGHYSARPGLGQAWQLGQVWAAARADHDYMPRGQRHHPAIGSRYGNPPVVVQPPVPADQLGADTFQPAGQPSSFQRVT